MKKKVIRELDGALLAVVEETCITTCCSKCTLKIDSGSCSAKEIEIQLIKAIQKEQNRKPRIGNIQKSPQSSF